MRELETERLKLRHLVKEDAQSIYKGWASDPEVTRYLTWNPHESVNVTGKILAGWLKEYENPDCYRYGIVLKTSNNLIGMIDVVRWDHGNPVIGYVLSRKYWRSGYMTECLRVVDQELFRCGYQEIMIDAMADNIASNKVIQKNGFQFVESKQQYIPAKQQNVLINYYVLKKE